MKKYGSVWALLARSSFPKIAAVLTGMAALEGGLLWARLRELRAESGELFGVYGQGPERLWADSYAWIVFLAAFGLVFAALVRTEGKRKDSRVEYTWRRLLLTKRELVTTAFLYNMLCFFVLFGVQAAVAVWFLVRYRETVFPGMVSPQLFFLAFMRSRHLHNVLPLMDAVKWVRNVLMLFALGLEAGKGAYVEAASNKTAAVLLFLLSAVCFYSDPGVSASDIGVTACCGIAVVIDLIRLSGVWKEHEE